VFATKRLSSSCDLKAPDGSEVRLLLSLKGGSMAHFRLSPGEVSMAVMHRTVEEIWYVVAGGGTLWRDFDGREEMEELSVGLCVTIPLGTRFQFCASAGVGLEIVAVTMPPWPGDGEAVLVSGPWPPTLRRIPS